MERLEFPARFEPNGEGGYIVSFRDVPEALTEGWSAAEAQKNAQDALVTAAEYYIKAGRDFPSPSARMENESLIELPLSVVIKMQLLEIMLKRKIRPVDLARKMNIKTQEVTRILDLGHITKIDTLDKATKALDMTLNFSINAVHP